MSVSVAIATCCETTGEGPHWDDVTASLVFVDILCGGVHRWTPATDQHESFKLNDDVGFVIPRDNGGYVIGLGKSLAFLDWESRSTTILHEVDEDPKNRFNDAKCDPTGRLWAGTMGHENAPAQPERHKGNLYSLEQDHTLRKHLDKIDISNGLAWSADHKTMYYIDSVPRKVYSFDFNKQTGVIENQRVCVDFGGEDTLPSLGYPDGMCIDTEGALWVACYGAGKVIRFDPVTGNQLQTVTFPAKRTTSCCFGGPQLDVLYVTCARTGLSEEELNRDQPLAGSVFQVTGLGVRGVAAVKFSG